MRALREQQGMPQQHIATVLTARYGLGWSQTTVVRTEAGQRPLRLVEAVAVAQVLGVPLGRLVGADLDTTEVAEHELDAVVDYVTRRRAALRHPGTPVVDEP